MHDAFTGQPTCLRGRRLPGPEERGRIQHDHERRLAALGRLRAAAEKCGVGEDSDRDLVLLAEDEVSLLEAAGGDWAELGAAIRAWRAWLPVRSLVDFGFSAAAESLPEESNPRLRYLHSGVEASAFVAVEDGSVYKFFLPQPEKRIGSEFGFRLGDESALLAEAQHGGYRGLLEKLGLIHALGLATEVVAITPEGILVAKQPLGDPLPENADTSRSLPAGLIEIPSRFLRANRDHPRLFFLGGQPWLVADLHARNFVRGADGALHVIDLVAAPWPVELERRDPFVREWLARVQLDPHAPVLREARDEEL